MEAKGIIEAVIKHEHHNVDEERDSIELSTPAKGGAVKIYGNFNNPEAFKKKIENAVEVRKFAQAQIGINV